MSHLIRDESRVATAVIRGFLYQLVAAVDRWINLTDEQLLIIEGNEDIDIVPPPGATIPIASEESVKDLAGKLTARSEAVYETIANFLIAFDHHLHSGRKCRLMFSTTAARGAQQTSGPASPALDYDLLAEWNEYIRGTSTITCEQLYFDIYRLVSTKHPSKSSTNRTEIPFRERLISSILRIAKRGQAHQFLVSVSFDFEQDNLDARQRSVLAKTKEMESGNAPLAAFLTERLIAEMWRAAATANIEARTFSHARLLEIRRATILRHAEWQAFSRMTGFISWTDWHGDRIAVGFSTAGQLICTAFCVSTRTDHDDKLITNVLIAARYDSVLAEATRKQLREGADLHATWDDAILRVRVLDAAKSAFFLWYADIRETEDSAQAVQRALAVRDRTSRARLEQAMSSQAEAASGIQSSARRPGFVLLVDLIARACLNPAESQSRDIFRWLFRKLKYLRLLDGTIHKSDRIRSPDDLTRLLQDTREGPQNL